MLAPRSRLFFLCTSSATSCSARSASIVFTRSRSYPSFGSAAACSLSFQRLRQPSSASLHQQHRQTTLASFSTSAPSSSSANSVTNADAASMGVEKAGSSGLRTMVWFRKVSFLFVLPFFRRRVAASTSKAQPRVFSLPPLFLSRACASTITRPSSRQRPSATLRPCSRSSCSTLIS